jgi:hypothetical protein
VDRELKGSTGARNHEIRKIKIMYSVFSSIHNLECVGTKNLLVKHSVVDYGMIPYPYNSLYSDTCYLFVPV